MSTPVPSTLPRSAARHADDREDPRNFVRSYLSRLIRVLSGRAATNELASGTCRNVRPALTQLRSAPPEVRVTRVALSRPVAHRTEVVAVVSTGKSAAALILVCRREGTGWRAAQVDWVGGPPEAAEAGLR